MNSIKDKWKVSANILLWILVLSLPYAPDIPPIVLGSLMVWSLLKYFYFKPLSWEGTVDTKLLIWILIPLIYLFSLSYSKNFVLGWHQWLDYLPLVILPFFFSLAKNRFDVKPILLAFGIASAIAVSLHYLYYLGWLNIKMRSMDPISLFYRSDINAWIWWSSAMTLLISFPLRHWAQCLSLVLILGLMYLGQVGLLFLIALGLIIHLYDRQSRSLFNISVLGIGVPILIYLGTSSFDYFASNLNTTGEKFSDLFMLEGFQFADNGYLREAIYTLNQWWKHAFNGVGMGDYIDAMWNEYHDHGLELPKAPQQQIGHMMVSAGLLTFVMLFGVYRSFSKGRPKEIHMALINILALIFMTPLLSHITSVAFILPILFVIISTFTDK